MMKPGSMFSVGINAFLSVVWLVSILISIFRNDYSVVFGLAWVSFICFVGATIVNFRIFKENRNDCCS